MGVRSYLGVARAPFLLLPPTLVAAGAAASAFEGAFSWPRTALALVGLVALHASVNALNEASDMRRGIDQRTVRTPFSGGSGTLPRGDLTVRQARVFGCAAAGIGLAIGLWFLARVGWPMAPLLAVGAVTVLGYTDVLARIGVGEVFAGLGLGALPVWGAALVQSGSPGRASAAAALPAFFMTFNLLLLNEFPDEAADRTGGRRNLVIIFGRPAAAAIYAGAAALTPLSIAVAVLAGALPTICLIALAPSLFVARAAWWALRRPAEPAPIPAMAGNVIWNLATNLALAAGFALAIVFR